MYFPNLEVIGISFVKKPSFKEVNLAFAISNEIVPTSLQERQ